MGQTEQPQPCLILSCNKLSQNLVISHAEANIVRIKLKPQKAYQRNNENFRRAYHPYSISLPDHRKNLLPVVTLPPANCTPTCEGGKETKINIFNIKIIIMRLPIKALICLNFISFKG